MKNQKDSRITITVKKVKGGVDLTLGCSTCGGSITHSDDYGMWCDKECGREDSIKASAQFVKFFKTLEDPDGNIGELPDQLKRIEKDLKRRRIL